MKKQAKPAKAKTPTYSLPPGAPNIKRMAPTKQPLKVKAPPQAPARATPKTSQRPAKQGVKAFHASDRSGYAADIMPERAATGMGREVPVATASGGQAGRVPPGVRKYNAKYEVVELEEAMSRAKARTKGTLPPIEGGLDFDGTQDPFTGAIETEVGGLDPFEAEGRITPVDVDEIVQVDAANRKEAQQRRIQVAAAPLRPIPPTPSRSQADAYLGKRMRVTIELPDTTLMVSAVDVVLSKYGILLLLPLASEQGTFIPKPGSELTLNWGDKAVKCYFPGGAFELEELGVFGLSFIRADE